MRHSGNYVSIVSQAFLLNGVEIKAYVYDELDRFVTVGRLLLSSDDLRLMQEGIEQRRREEREQEQQPLPPWQ